MLNRKRVVHGPTAVIAFATVALFVLAGAPTTSHALARASDPTLTTKPGATLVVTSYRAAAPATPHSQWLNPPGADPYSLSLSWTQSTDSCFGAYGAQYLSPAFGYTTWQGLFAGTYQANETSFWASELPGGTLEFELVDGPCSGSPTYSFANFTLPAIAKLTCTPANSISVSCSWNNNARYGGYLHFGSYELFEERVALGGGTTTFPVTTITNEADMTYIVEGLSPGASYGFYLNTTDACSGYWGCGFGTTGQSSAQSIVNPFTMPTGASNNSAGSQSSPDLLYPSLLVSLAVVGAAALVSVAIYRRRSHPPKPPA
jgi:hypothetical protein